MVVKVGIGFGYHNFLLVLFDWYCPHPYTYSRASTFHLCFTILCLRKYGILCTHSHVLEKKKAKLNRAEQYYK